MLPLSGCRSIGKCWLIRLYLWILTWSLMPHALLLDQWMVNKSNFFRSRGLNLGKRPIYSEILFRIISCRPLQRLERHPLLVHVIGRTLSLYLLLLLVVNIQLSCLCLVVSQSLLCEKSACRVPFLVCFSLSQHNPIFLALIWGIIALALKVDCRQVRSS